jgi:hypothetical protein
MLRTLMIVTAALLLITDAGTSEAATLVAGPLEVPGGVSNLQIAAGCRAINVSRKAIDVVIELHRNDGTLLISLPCTLAPGTDGGCNALAENDPAAVYCKVSGAKGHAVRATLTVFQSDGNPSATATAQ